MGALLLLNVAEDLPETVPASQRLARSARTSAATPAPRCDLRDKALLVVAYTPFINDGAGASGHGGPELAAAH
jgi:hypothetical protein